MNRSQSRAVHSWLEIKLDRKLDLAWRHERRGARSRRSKAARGAKRRGRGRCGKRARGTTRVIEENIIHGRDV